MQIFLIIKETFQTFPYLNHTNITQLILGRNFNEKFQDRKCSSP